MPVPVYASRGFSPIAAPEASAELAVSYLEADYAGVKPRVNANDKGEAVLRTVRKAIGDEAQFMVNANEKGRGVSARLLLQRASEYGLLFVEEPLPADDFMGYRRLVREQHGTSVATGEHLQGLDRFGIFLEDRLTKVIQPDLAMADSLTPCLELAVWRPHME